MKQNLTYLPKAKELKAIYNIDGDFKEFKNLIYSNPCILVIIGKKNSGKTALGLNLFETIVAKSGKKGFTVFFPKKLPECFYQVNFIELVPNDVVTFIDEAGITLPAGTTVTKKQKFYNNLMMTAFHQSLSFIFTVQNSANLSINALRQADALMIKEPGLFQSATERPFIRKICEKAKEVFKKIDKPERKKYVYVISDEFIGLCKNSLPTFWNDEIRHAYRRTL